MKRKELTPLAPLDEAIKSLEGAIESLDEMIDMMQKNQELIRSWITPGKSVGWMETNEEDK